MSDGTTVEACLIGLPEDLSLHIFSMCDIQAVIQLRQSCKRLNEISKNPFVWIGMLQRTYSELHLGPLPQVSFDRFSTSDIELLATAWIKFKILLRQTKEGTTPIPITNRVIKMNEAALALAQTPNGRHLVVLTNAGISIWDLHTPYLTQVASCALELPVGCVASIELEMEPDGVCVGYVMSSAQSPRVSQVHVFRLNFSSYDEAIPELNLLSRLDRVPFSSSPWGNWDAHLNDPVLVTCFEDSTTGKHYLAWDFVQGTCAIWLADPLDKAAVVHTYLTLVRGYLVVFDRASKAVVIYSQPEIPSKESYAPRHCAEIVNPALLSLPPDDDALRRQLVATPYWITSFHGSSPASDCRGADWIWNTGDANYLLERIRVSRTESPSADMAPLPLALDHLHSVPIFNSLSFPITSVMITRSYTFPDQCILIHGVSEDRSQVVFQLSSPTGHDCHGTELGRGLLYDSHNMFTFSRTHYSVCPVAGRVCIATLEGVELVEFVELPYSRSGESRQQSDIESGQGSET